MNIGDVCISHLGESLILVSKTFDSTPVLVYNLEVENCHTYFVGNENCSILVHNDYDYGYDTTQDVMIPPLVAATPNPPVGNQVFIEEPGIIKSFFIGMWDGVHNGLDIAGLIPGVGEFADGANAAIYFAEGDKFNAGISTASMVPFLGWFTTGGKAVKKTIGVVDDVVEQTTKRADNVVDAGKNVAESAEKQSIQEALEKGELHLTKIARPPRHHVFPQEHRKWFEERGIDIDKYTLELDQGTHSALHTMGWNDEIMRHLKLAEYSKGKNLTSDEILEIGNAHCRQMKVDNIPYIPYRD
jgi:hypothetical protein